MGGTNQERGTLYVVATPIGNLEDMTYRAVRILSEVSLIAAEDTRHTKQLCNHFDIKTQLHSCHKFNEAGKIEFFLKALGEGKDVALVSDAGTPCVSDPGFRLVSSASEAGFTVTSVCGACAAAAALSVSGFDASGFHFLGFLPRAEKHRAEAFNILRGGKPVVFYESPRRVASAVKTLAGIFPDVWVCLCNDLTKKFERIYRGRPEEVLRELTDNPNAEKGEYVCVVCADGQASGTDSRPKTDDGTFPNGNIISEGNSPAELSLEARLIDIMVKESVTLKDAVKRMKGNKNAAYDASLKLKDMLKLQTPS